VKGLLLKFLKKPLKKEWLFSGLMTGQKTGNKRKENFSAVPDKLFGKRMNIKMTKSADDTELLMITKLKMSIKDFEECHSQVDEDSPAEDEGGACNMVRAERVTAVCRKRVGMRTSSCPLT